MQLGRFKRGIYRFIGAVVKEWVVDVGRLTGLQSGGSDMKVFLEGADWEELKVALQTTDIQYCYGLNEVEILAPLANPGKVLCIGLNYLDHAAESEMKLPVEPVFFNKFATSITGPGQPIILPSISKQVDFEAELAIVIGKTGKAVTRDKAMELVAGYTVFNDVSARDLQFQDGQWVKGKALDSFAPIGPYLVTTDEISDPHQLAVRLWLNEQLMQNGNTSQMIFKIPELISYLSRFFTLEPGDIIATGTPPGVGFVRKPPVYLKDGDMVTIEIEGIGRLSNPVTG